VVNCPARLNWTASVAQDEAGVAQVVLAALAQGANARVSCPTGARAATTTGEATVDESDPDKAAIMTAPAAPAVGATAAIAGAIAVTLASVAQWVLVAPVVLVALIAAPGAKVASASARQSGAVGKTVAGVGFAFCLHTKG